MKDNINFGQAFHTIRLLTGKKVTDFEHLGISSATISRFESGKSMMAVDKFYAALREMDISIVEFEQVYLEKAQAGLGKIYERLYEAYWTMDVETIRELIDKAESPLVKIALKCTIADFTGERLLTAKDSETMMTYFWQTTKWGVFEFSVLQFCIAQFNDSQIIRLLNKMFDDTQHYHNVTLYRTYIIETLMKGTFKLAREKENGVYVVQFIQKALETKRFTDFFLSNIIDFVDGVKDYNCFGKMTGLDKMEAAIITAEKLGGEIAKKYLQALAYSIT